MLRYIIRRLRGDNTLWKHLNERIDGLEHEVRTLRQICEQYEAHQAHLNLGLLTIIELMQKEKSPEAVQKQLRQMLEHK